MFLPDRKQEKAVSNTSSICSGVAILLKTAHFKGKICPMRILILPIIVNIKVTWFFFYNMVEFSMDKNNFANKTVV